MRRLYSILRITLKVAFALLLILLVGLGAGYAWLQTDGGKRWLAGEIEAAASAKSISSA